MMIFLLLPLARFLSFVNCQHNYGKVFFLSFFFHNLNKYKFAEQRDCVSPPLVVCLIRVIIGSAAWARHEWITLAAI